MLTDATLSSSLTGNLKGDAGSASVLSALDHTSFVIRLSSNTDDGEVGSAEAWASSMAPSASTAD